MKWKHGTWYFQDYFKKFHWSSHLTHLEVIKVTIYTESVDENEAVAILEITQGKWYTEGISMISHDQLFIQYMNKWKQDKYILSN